MLNEEDAFRPTYYADPRTEGPPVYPKTRTGGPSRRRHSTRSPIVRASRPNASATREAVRPQAGSQNMCQLSHSQGVSARCVCSRTGLASNRQRPNTTSICTPARADATASIPDT
jgi:hypothetical protein